MRKVIIAAMTLALFISVSARPANNFDPFLSRLQGAWNGEGTAFGSKATVQQKWEWTLGDKFLRLSLKYETKAADGKTQVFEGHGYYKAKGEGKYEGQWFDSQGNQYPINATLEGDALIALWGIPGRVEGKKGKTLALFAPLVLFAVNPLHRQTARNRKVS
jgi:hypothetical protein